MRELGIANTSAEGTLDVLLAVPEWAEPGRLYFSLRLDGERVAIGTFNVVVLLDVAPSGVGGAGAN
jgi:hypothetical protein